MHRIAVFCGSGHGQETGRYGEAARQMGEVLARRQITLVYGAGRLGLMGAVAEAAIRAGGAVIGVIPQALVDLEVAHPGLTELHVVQTMHERKALMAELSDAFVALPGGYGTLEEFLEVLTWAQLGIHRKPCGLLNTHGFYDPLLSHFDHLAAEGFISPAHRRLVIEDTDPTRLLDRLVNWIPPVLRRKVEWEEV